MSLRADYYYDAPGAGNYERRELIAEEQRCKVCEGLGFFRIRHSMTGRDWVICLDCYGTGKITE